MATRFWPWALNATRVGRLASDPTLTLIDTGLSPSSTRNSGERGPHRSKNKARHGGDAIAAGRCRSVSPTDRMLRTASQARAQCSRIAWVPHPTATRTTTIRIACRRSISTTSSSRSDTSSRPTVTLPLSTAQNSAALPPAKSRTPSKRAPTIGSIEARKANPDLERYVRQLAAHSGAPDLMELDPLTDPVAVHNIPPTPEVPYANQIIFRHPDGLYTHYEKMLRELGVEPEPVPREDSEASGFNLLPYSQQELRALHRYPLVTRRVSQQTGKGKIHRQAVLLVVGNGDGLVGLGLSKNEDLPVAADKAFLEAVRNMDYVARFEERTVWTEMSIKFGSTQVILRPRPVGFGLHCNPYIHQILKAAGIKDCSAKVWGSRNPVNVVMATMKLLQAGNAPLGMGDGIGGRGKRMEKGSGMRTAGDLERERGRKLTSLRTV